MDHGEKELRLKHLFAIATFLTAGTAVTYGAPACLPAQTLSSLIALGAGGCEIADKIYSNFSYSPGAGDPTSAQVNVGVDNATAIFQTGLQFGSSGLVWSSGFTVGYTVAVDPTACVAIYGAGKTCSVNAAQLAFQGALASSSNTAALTAAFSGASPGSVSVNDLTTGANVNQIFFSPNFTATSVVITGSVNTLAFPIDSFGLDIYQQVASTAPEPATMFLIGGSLLGLGMFGRKKIARK
jgi:hypothetical protein